MNRVKNNDIDRLFEAILTLRSVDECYDFFEDACTIKEILDIAQRFKAAQMLRDGANYVEIAKETGMSTATISRVSRCIEYGNGGYARAIARLKGDEA